MSYIFIPENSIAARELCLSINVTIAIRGEVGQIAARLEHCPARTMQIPVGEGIHHCAMHFLAEHDLLGVSDIPVQQRDDHVIREQCAGECGGRKKIRAVEIDEVTAFGVRNRHRLGGRGNVLLPSNIVGV